MNIRKFPCPNSSIHQFRFEQNKPPDPVAVELDRCQLKKWKVRIEKIKKYYKKITQYKKVITYASLEEKIINE